MALGDGEVHWRDVGTAREAAPMVLGHPRAAAGVLALTNDDVARRGCPWPSCDVALVAAGASEAAAVVVGQTARRAVVASSSEPAWRVLAAAVPRERLIAVGPLAAASDGHAAPRAVLWRLDGAHLRLAVRRGNELVPLRAVADPGTAGAREAAALVTATEIALGLVQRTGTGAAAPA